LLFMKDSITIGTEVVSNLFKGVGIVDAIHPDGLSCKVYLPDDGVQRHIAIEDLRIVHRTSGGPSFPFRVGQMVVRQVGREVFAFYVVGQTAGGDAVLKKATAAEYKEYVEKLKARAKSST
jgi:hypothetical protein